MSPSLAVPVFLISLMALILPILWVWGRSQQSAMKQGFGILSERFESLQRHLLVAQAEFERSQEVKTATLRNEVATELQTNRRELQQGLGEMSRGVQGKLEQNLQEGFRYFAKVEASLKQTEIQLQGLNAVGHSINDLNNLLKLPHLRGNFGEAVLERLLADLLPAGHFELQYRIVPGSTERVDAVIKYPQCVLPIDSKFPREQVLPLFEVTSPEQLEAARKTLATVMKALSREIKEKYIRPEHGTTEMALLFVPSETLYFECLRDPRLWEELGRNKVFAVSPNTLAVTLHAISISRNYYEMAKGVEKTVAEIKKAQSHFDHFERRFEEIGLALGRAQSAFQTADTHLSRYTGAVLRLTGEEPAGKPPEKLPEATT